jgi:predicted ester cyclase
LGNRKIIADTHHTTGAFSNIQLIADEVVWAGDDEVGYHTSHRTLIRGTNDGASRYGPATGKNVDVLVIANCVALDNRIFLEHVLYNNSCLLQQLGFDLPVVAERMVAQSPAGWPRDRDTWRELRRAASPVLPLSVAEPVSGFDVDAFVRRNFDDLWNRQQPDRLARNYHADFAFQGPTDRAFVGGAAYRDFLDSLHCAFPDLLVQVDEVYWMGNDHDGYLTCARWSALGTHEGSGPYGPATGAEMQIWGISQYRIIGRRIANEWTLFNELDLMMQISAARR